jgi:hypothetical protein
MLLKAEPIELWVTELEDTVGSLAALLEQLAKAGADLQYILARRSKADPGKGVAFISSVVGEAQEKAAAAAGFRKSKSIHGVRITGANEPGMGFHVTDALAREGINLHGLAAAVANGQCIIHLAVDSEEDAAKVIKVVHTL